MSERNEVRVEFLSLPENVGLSRTIVAAVASQLDFTLPELDEIRTATSEAISNAIIHGYDERPGEVVRLETLIDGQTLTVVVSDRGKGIRDIDQARSVQFTTRPGRYGLGFTFMEAFMDSLEVQSKEGEGTLVRMTKRPEAAERKEGSA